MAIVLPNRTTAPPTREAGFVQCDLTRWGMPPILGLVARDSSCSSTSSLTSHRLAALLTDQGFEQQSRRTL